MRKDDPSSRRTRRRKVQAEPPLELGAGGRTAARKTRAPQPPPLDQDFGLALCLLPALKTRKLPDA
jgi:hypothetical protein